MVASLGVSLDNIEKDLVWLIMIGLFSPDIDLTSRELDLRRADVPAIINTSIALLSVKVKTVSGSQSLVKYVRCLSIHSNTSCCTPAPINWKVMTTKLFTTTPAAFIILHVETGGNNTRSAAHQNAHAQVVEKQLNVLERKSEGGKQADHQRIITTSEDRADRGLGPGLTEWRHLHTASNTDTNFPVLLSYWSDLP